jgi:hypothetical protein
VKHYHVIEGRVVEPWDVYDKMATLAQIKLGAMAAVVG